MEGNVYLVCIGMLSFLLGMLFLKRNKTRAIHIVILWVVLALLSQIGFHYVAIGAYVSHVRFFQFVFGTLLLHAPLLFFYVKAELEPNFVFKYKDLLHLTPLVLFYLLHIPEFSQNVGLSICSRHFGCYLSNKPCSVAYSFIKIIVNSFYIMLACIAYRDLNIRVTRKTNEQKMNFLWVKILLIAVVSLHMLVVIYRLLEVGEVYVFSRNLFIINVLVSYYIIVFSFVGCNFIGILGFLSVLQKRFSRLKKRISCKIDECQEQEIIPTINTNIPYGLSSDEIDGYVNTLNELMKTDKPYLDHHLTRNKLAELTSIPGHHLTHVIKERYQQTFTDFINSWRLNLLLEKLDDPKCQNYTLLSLAFECGFNSKSTFNRYFKSQTGKTPTEFIKLKHENMEIGVVG